MYPSMNRQLIYCVDDEESIRSLYEEALPMGGYLCRTFGEASSFLEALGKERPDLVILDVMLPKEDGFAVLRSLLAKGYSSLPVIMVSAKGSETDRVKGLNEGAYDYIVKPFGVMELLARVKANLRKGGGASQIAYKDLSLSRDRHEILLKGEPIALSLKEFDLLAYFIENPAKALSKEELLSKVWGVDCELETRTLDMFVSKIRKHLGSGEASIKTLRGLGYMLL